MKKPKPVKKVQSGSNSHLSIPNEVVGKIVDDLVNSKIEITNLTCPVCKKQFIKGKGVVGNVGEVCSNKCDNKAQKEIVAVEELTTKEKISNSAIEYRMNIEVASVEVKDSVAKLCNNNLLKMKLTLWGALKLVEDKMREMKNGQ